MSPARAVVEFTPFFSNSAIRPIDCSKVKPISLNTELFSRTLFISVSTEIPVSCALTVMSPRTFGVCDASIFHACMILLVMPIELFRSVSLICANSINCLESVSSVSPVAPKRVFTSPIAIPAFSAVVGKSPKTAFMLF